MNIMENNMPKCTKMLSVSFQFTPFDLQKSSNAFDKLFGALISIHF